jgi:hypothetical protein
MAITIDPKIVKARSEKIIRKVGGDICDWLPFLDRATLRPREQVVGRALVMNALINIHFQAPTKVIDAWIQHHNLQKHLCESERKVLKSKNPSEQQSTNLFWYLESLWALMWVGNLIESLPFDQHVEDRLASMCPNLQENEGIEKFSSKIKLRSDDETFEMLDLYYRLHWWTRDAQLNGRKAGKVSLDIIMERRKALEWCMDESVDWDNVPDGT